MEEIDEELVEEINRRLRKTESKGAAVVAAENSKTAETAESSPMITNNTQAPSQEDLFAPSAAVTTHMVSSSVMSRAGPPIGMV